MIRVILFCFSLTVMQSAMRLRTVHIFGCRDRRMGDRTVFSMEQQILSTLQSGNRKRALELMARAWWAQLGRFCTGMVGSSAEAEELLQETFIIAWQDMDAYRGEGSLRAWLYGIAHRVCASHLRKRDRRRGLLTRFFGDGKTPEPSTEETAWKNEEIRLLEKALLELRPQWREAVLLYYQGQFSMQQVAELLSVSPANARKRVSLGVAALRESLHPVLMRPTRDEGGQNEDESNQSVQ